jgi:death-on-curing protein
MDLIESAIARPYSGYYRSIAEKAAALTQSVASNHGFNDGNKRTTLILLNLLIRQSGYGFRMRDPKRLNDDLEWLILSVVEHRLEFDELVLWIGRRLVRS